MSNAIILDLRNILNRYLPCPACGFEPEPLNEFFYEYIVMNHSSSSDAPIGSIQMSKNPQCKRCAVLIFNEKPTTKVQMIPATKPGQAFRNFISSCKNEAKKAESYLAKEALSQLLSK